MSTLFKPIKLGPIEIQNRFIHSATYEGTALVTGEVTDETLKRYRNLAKGEVGLIIPGYMCISKVTGAHSCIKQASITMI